MPIRLSDIVAKQRWLEVDISGEIVNVAYTPNTITLRRSGELERMTETFDNNPDLDIGVETARMFCDLVNAWDIFGEDDRQYPINVEALQDFPANILMLILAAVREDLGDNEDVGATEDSKKVSSATSDIGSSPAGSMVPVPTGIR